MIPDSTNPAGGGVTAPAGYSTTGSFNVTVTAAPDSGSFNSAIALACSGLPQNLACSFSPASITPGGSAVSSVLTVAAAKVTATDHRERNNFLAATWLVSFGLFGLTLIGKMERKRIVTVLGACALAAMIVGGTSCGGGGKTSSVVNTPSAGAAAYTITIQGSSSSVQLATTVTVTVQ